jgi:predicted RNA-binding Zn-ribbon protein involved in translation (DUF1610 family)
LKRLVYSHAFYAAAAMRALQSIGFWLRHAGQNVREREGANYVNSKIGARSPMRKATLLRTLLAHLAAEHSCYPPDTNTTWLMIAEQSAAGRSGDVYVCPECGQHLVRSASTRRAA